MRKPLESVPRPRLIRPLSFSPAVEVWRARMGRRFVVLRRYLPARPGAPWPSPPDPAVLAAVNHPALVRFLDCWQDDDAEVHAFAEARGETLADILVRGPLPPDRWTEVVSRCAVGLRWLHVRCPIAPRLHGDVSPRNILVTGEGRVRWLDVRADRPGIPMDRPEATSSSARDCCAIRAPSPACSGGPLARDGVILGTLPYLAPEVLRGEPPTEASEVYALGLVALAAATGPLPWREAASPRDMLAAFDATPPAARAVLLPPPAARLLAAMLAPARGDRPTADDVARHLR